MRTAALLLILLAAASADAHGLDLRATTGATHGVVATYEDGSAFSFESYEVFPPGDDTPFQVGRTDRLGRLAFQPDKPGVWRVRLFTTDGHGGELKIDVETPSQPAAAAPSRGRDILTGVSVLFGLFGLVTLFVRRK